MSERPTIVDIDEAPDRLTLTWRGTLVVRLFAIGFAVVCVAGTPFAMAAIKGVTPKILFPAISAITVGFAIAAWNYRGQIELTATRLISTERWGIVRTNFDHDPADITKLDAYLKAVSTGKGTSLQWQLRAVLAKKDRFVVAVLPGEDVAHYVCEQLTRRLAKLDEMRSATPYR